MDFKQALSHSLKIDKRTLTDPFLLHSRVSDFVGNDYEAKKAAEEFYRLDAKYEISKTILGSAPVRYKKRQKHYYKVKPMPIPQENAYVYFGKDTSILHLSEACPCLKSALQIHRTTYDHARTLDFKRKYLPECSWFYKMRHRGSIARLSKLHKPHICRRCGDFRVKQAKGIFYKLGKWIFERMYIDLRWTTGYSPSTIEFLQKG